jgi:oligopeptide/dipeptide ABC transporter ATP-binding protein
MTELALEVEDLRIGLRGDGPDREIVRGISFSLKPGETLGILGESGSGKSMTAEAIMGLERDPVAVLGGHIRFFGTELTTMSRRERRSLSGSDIAMVFQDSLAALNPSFTIGWQISEMYKVHAGASRKEARKRTFDLLERVGIDDPDRRYRDYPHQFSGGMRQRVMIAMAASTSPRLLIADEPTTALDVTVQAQILKLLSDMQHALGMAMIIITHDLGVIAEVADSALVMYAGSRVEYGPAFELTADPKHPYTSALLAAVPSLHGDDARLQPIRGVPPEATQVPSGCPFHPRCEFASDLCSTVKPLDEPLGIGRTAACHNLRDLANARATVVRP